MRVFRLGNRVPGRGPTVMYEIELADLASERTCLECVHFSVDGYTAYESGSIPASGACSKGLIAEQAWGTSFPALDRSSGRKRSLARDVRDMMSWLDTAKTCPEYEAEDWA